VPASCLNGSIWWNYPQGILRVTWHQDKPFTVCLTNDIGPLLSNITQVFQHNEIPVDNPQGNISTENSMISVNISICAA
jgi:hypothetical protein